MLKFFKSIEKTLIFCLEGLLFVLLFLAFFGPYFSEQTELNAELLRISRISIIPMSTFAVLEICFIRIYGGFAVGVKKTKEIVYSMFLATLITDVITYLQLSVMMKRFPVNSVFLPDWLAPFLSLVVQYLLILGFSYFGNFVYFKINKPVPCTVIYGNEAQLPVYLKKIGKYKKQWVVKDIVHYLDDDIKQRIRANETVFIFDVPRGLRNDFIEYCYKHNKNIEILPDVADVIINNSKHLLLDDTSMYESRVDALTFEQRVIKRSFDIVLSGIGLIIASPFMLVEAIAIKLYDRGPVFFRQERMTEGGRVFKVIKFRTMVVDAEKNTGAVLSSKNDSRITPVGKFFRATRLDELPQLINIFVGDMSIVGPRPERESIAEEYSKELPEFRYRLKVKAGLTGLAQIMGKYNTTPKDKLTLDLVYIEQYSVWLDLKLMFQTLKVLFKSDSTEGVDNNEQVEFVKHEAQPVQQEDGE